MVCFSYHIITVKIKRRRAPSEKYLSVIIWFTVSEKRARQDVGVKQGEREKDECVKYSSKDYWWIIWCWIRSLRNVFFWWGSWPNSLFIAGRYARVGQISCWARQVHAWRADIGQGDLNAEKPSCSPSLNYRQSCGREWQDQQTAFEQHDRNINLILRGVPEEDEEDETTSTCVDILNKHLPTKLVSADISVHIVSGKNRTRLVPS